MPSFLFFQLVLTAVLWAQGVYKSDEIRSSYLIFLEGHVMLGHVTKVQSSQGVSSCAQRCLSVPGCLSFNFAKDNSQCELNNSSSQFASHFKDLTVKQGVVYGHWITLPIMRFVFTTLGGQGPVGPTNTSGYLGTHWKVKFILTMVFKSGKFRIQESILSKRLELQEPMVLAQTVLDGNLEVEEPKCPVSLNLAVDKS